MDKSQETWLAYMEQAEGMIRDQQELIEVQRQTIEVLKEVYQPSQSWFELILVQ